MLGFGRWCGSPLRGARRQYRVEGGSSDRVEGRSSSARAVAAYVVGSGRGPPPVSAIGTRLRIDSGRLVWRVIAPLRPFASGRWGAGRGRAARRARRRSGGASPVDHPTVGRSRASASLGGRRPDPRSSGPSRPAERPERRPPRWAGHGREWSAEKSVRTGLAGLWSRSAGYRESSAGRCRSPAGRCRSPASQRGASAGRCVGSCRCQVSSSGRVGGCGGRLGVESVRRVAACPPPCTTITADTRQRETINIMVDNDNIRYVVLPIKLVHANLTYDRRRAKGAVE